MAEKIEVYPFRRLKRESKKNYKDRPKKKKTIYQEESRFKPFQLYQTIVFCISGFLLGRAMLLETIAPFAQAFIASATWVYPSFGVIVLIGSVTGLAISKNLPLAPGAITVLTIWLLILNLPRDTKKPWIIIPGIAFAITLVIKTGYLAFIKSSPYDYIGIVFEATFSGIFTLIFLYTLPSFRKLDGLQSLNAEELFCILIFLTSLVAGTGGLEIWEISLQGFFCRLIILISALVGGMGQGAAAGALMGVIPGLAYVQVPVIIGAYSFAGLLAGICRGLGKIGVATGFLLGNIILCVFLQNFDHLITVLLETGLAIFFFFLMPSEIVKKLTASLAIIISPDFIGGSKDLEKIRAAASGYMRKWSVIFRELSHSFSRDYAASSDFQEETTFQDLFNEIGQKVCNGCGFYRTCWEREFYRTYQDFLDMFALIETYGQINANDLPEVLRRRCTRARELAVTVNCLYDTYKLNQYWMRRLAESKEIFSEQLKGVSEIIENLSNQFHLEIFNQKEVIIKEKLKQKNIPVVEVKICQSGKDKKEITIIRQPCSDKNDCYIRLALLVSGLTEESLMLPTVNCTCSGEDKLCYIKLYPVLKYRLKIGIAKASRNGSLVSGDSFAFLPLKEGKFAIILSDGMGTGSSAAFQSGTTISLLEHLLKAGFKHDLAIKTVNSLMILRSGRESFATLDMVVLDLYSGQAEFTKIAASPSFIKRGKRVTQVRTSSLPVGIIKDIDVTSVVKNLLAGDLVVMISDGLLDIYPGPLDKEEWLKEILQDTGELEPQEIADLLLELAKTKARGKVNDDITILTVKLEK